MMINLKKNNHLVQPTIYGYMILGESGYIVIWAQIMAWINLTCKLKEKTVKISGRT